MKAIKKFCAAFIVVTLTAGVRQSGTGSSKSSSWRIRTA